MKRLELILIKIKKNKTAGRGFTLVELLVSITIFSVSMIVVSQLFSYSMKAQKVLVAHAQLVNEASYNMEHITRGLRMAKKSFDDACLASPNLNYQPTTHTWTDMGKPDTHGIKFQSPTAATNQYDCVEYYMGYDAPGYNGVAALMEYRRFADGTAFSLPLTSPDIELLNFRIEPNRWGWEQEDELQPRVTLSLEMKGGERQAVSIQTTVSQRNPDIRI